MQVFDASSVIYAWDVYPNIQFPAFWDWLGTQIEEKNLVIPRVAFEEVKKKTPDCAAWLSNFNINILEHNNIIMQKAVGIKGLLGIKDENYCAKGVGENDLLIIATASFHKSILISEEARQPGQLKQPANRKIPAVCAMPEVSVTCINFLEFIKSTGEIFR